MSTEHQLRQAAARCLSLLQRYHDDGRTPAAKAKMAAEVEVVIGWLMELKPPPGALKNGLLKPVRAQLLAQHGHEAGWRLNQDFLEAFGRAGTPLLFKDSPVYFSVN